ncbi:hypothetical protein CEXT_397261 [Caerostris extrusa]|uniref:Uncharacterized protein n=1 Tax=Caerostris extrusa TaxID=172846 RepID=A0AAV4XEI8_CAEEX|nr:hypothetical protein CEXT_397261 [Caerostris extrusa]
MPIDKLRCSKILFRGTLPHLLCSVVNPPTPDFPLFLLSNDHRHIAIAIFPFTATVGKLTALTYQVTLTSESNGFHEKGVARGRDEWWDVGVGCKEPIPGRTREHTSRSQSPFSSLMTGKRKFNVIHHRTDSPENVPALRADNADRQTALFENTLSWNPRHLLCSVVIPPTPLFFLSDDRPLTGAIPKKKKVPFPGTQASWWGYSTTAVERITVS